MADTVAGSKPLDLTLIRDPLVHYPELYMEVYVAGDVYEQEAFADWMVQAACTFAETPQEADLVVFTGGADVSPELYNMVPHRTTANDFRRDEEDFDLFKLCIDEGIPMLGVCRGAQFGAVMHGAKLYQDVDGHYQDHNMWDTRTKALIHPVSSVHHQMIMADETSGMEVLGYSRMSRRRDITDNIVETSMIDDVEAVWFKDTGFFGVQGHPEYRGYPYYSQWVFKQLDKLFNHNPDYELRNNLRRMTEKAMEKRSYDLDKVLKDVRLPF